MAKMRRGIILDHRGQPMRSQPVRARYDSAQTNANNCRHWANADALSADAAGSASVRRILRNRSRYEIANNSYARGIVSTLADYSIGTGPRLQALTNSPKENLQIERSFTAWALAAQLAQRLRTMRMARTGDGENFAVLANNPQVRGQVKLDVVPVEADRITDETAQVPRAGYVDGIKYDQHGNPVSYNLLKQHPGGLFVFLAGGSQTIPADKMIHGYRANRPGQSRGIPELTPALPLFAQLRRYTLAVLAAAETAANQSGILHTPAPAEEDENKAEAGDPFEELTFERNMWTVLPEGYDISQFKAEQPTTVYPEFKREVINEIARAINMPYNIAAGNSVDYNYASGRLDHQAFFRAVMVDQSIIELQEVERIFGAWQQEAVLIEGLLPQRWRMMGAVIPHKWFWDGNDHVDPKKEADGQAVRLGSASTNLAREYGRLGLDWRQELEQRAIELEFMRKRNIPIARGASASTAGVDAEDLEEANA